MPGPFFALIDPRDLFLERGNEKDKVDYHCRSPTLDLLVVIAAVTMQEHLRVIAITRLPFVLGINARKEDPCPKRQHNLCTGAAWDWVLEPVDRVVKNAIDFPFSLATENDLSFSDSPTLSVSKTFPPPLAAVIKGKSTSPRKLKMQ